jgi:hypothetical protein
LQTTGERLPSTSRQTVVTAAASHRATNIGNLLLGKGVEKKA